MTAPPRKKRASFYPITARALERDGWVGGKVEQLIPSPVKIGQTTYFELKVKRDFLGCIDGMWYRGLETLAVQWTNSANLANHGHKVLMECPKILDFLFLGSSRRFQIWGWRKLGGGRLWSAKVVELVRTPRGVTFIDQPDQPSRTATASDEASSEPAEESA